MEDVTNRPRPSQSDDTSHLHDGTLKPTVPVTADGTAAESRSYSDGLNANIEYGIAADLEKLTVTNAKLDAELLNIITTHPILHDYLFQNSSDYRELTILRNEGWANKEADVHFMMLREKADNVTPDTQQVFYEQMCKIGNDMDKAYDLSVELELSGDQPQFLDICMAPGGFSGTILENAFRSRVGGISLPIPSGGHPLCIRDWENRADIRVHFLDVTMLATEMGLTNIPPDHPEFSEFLTLRPFEGEQFGLVFCDGNVLRTHVRATYRERKERHRLLTSQLVLAFQRIETGGTLVCRFHKIEGIETVNMLRLFNMFSKIHVWKPLKTHAARSSFYMIAKDVQPHSPEAVKAINEWKREWKEFTLNTEEESVEVKPAFDNNDPIRVETAKNIIEEFGQQLIDLARPIWNIQSHGMRAKPFNTGKPTTFRIPRGRRYFDGAGAVNVKSGHSNPWNKGTMRAALEHPEAKTASRVPVTKLQRYLPPQQRRNSFMNGDPRLANGAKPIIQESEGISPLSPMKTDRYLVPQQRRSSFITGDLRESIKVEIGNPSPNTTSPMSILKTDGCLASHERHGPFMNVGPRLKNSTKPKHLYDSFVPVNSSFWKGDPRTSMVTDASQDWQIPPPEEDISPAQIPRRRPIDSNKINSLSIGRPGGSLIGATVTKNASASPARQIRPNEKVDVHITAATSDENADIFNDSTTKMNPSHCSTRQRYTHERISVSSVFALNEYNTPASMPDATSTKTAPAVLTDHPSPHERSTVPVVHKPSGRNSFSAGNTGIAHANVFDVLAEEHSDNDGDSQMTMVTSSTNSSLHGEGSTSESAVVKLGILTHNPET
ncbi:hypothetical protein BKA67DRAFT_646047 [Truncatella angustata]|uniref:Ribosomal RNA methyltransferase FtsJ domain-containing protein n=1 Tax=Truncatella angustata TaxID=152316 RepID=A0A9P8ULK1_9PEZI|nr:uncharacterized protein BKA67DRAFT_646047 [Truncatella angustata]KAH6654301.1 hypothetical protein BKA67DRAFT_646047 [Truncatella angustata]